MEKKRMTTTGFFIATGIAVFSAWSWTQGFQWMAIFFITWAVWIIAGRQAKHHGY